MQDALTEILDDNISTGAPKKKRARPVSAVPPSDLLWGASQIAAYLQMPERRVFHWLENGKIKCARKVGGDPDKKRGGRWCVSASRLLAEINGDA